jgi:hypothetical protein
MIDSGSGDSGGGDDVVFVTETWMWRRQGEAPVLLERDVGK